MEYGWNLWLKVSFIICRYATRFFLGSSSICTPRHFCWESSISDVSSEGKGGGSPSKPIYYISLFSNLSRQREGGGSWIGKSGSTLFMDGPLLNLYFWSKLLLSMRWIHLFENGLYMKELQKYFFCSTFCYHPEMLKFHPYSILTR